MRTRRSKRNFSPDRVADVLVASIRQLRQCIDHHQAGDQREETSQVALADHDVHDLSLKQWRQQAEHGENRDQDTRHCQRFPVRIEIAEKTFE